MASFLARALDLPPSVKDWFSDDDGSTHEDNINKIADDGVTLGCDAEGHYRPGDNVRRDQMASLLGRALGLDPIFPPPPTTTTTTTGTGGTTTTTTDATDTEDPTWPGGAVLTVTGMSDTTMIVDWSANPATDNVGVSGYNVYVDDVFDQTATDTNATVTGLSPSTTYTIRVEARDVVRSHASWRILTDVAKILI